MTSDRHTSRLSNPWSWGRLGLGVVVVIIVAFLVLPILVVFPMAVSPGRYMVFPPSGVSFRWFNEYFYSDKWLDATLVSLRVGVISTLISVALGTSAAFSIVRGRFFGKGALFGLLMSPWIVPEIVIAISMFFVASRLQLVGNSLVLAAAQAVLSIPLVVVVVASTLKGFDKTYEWAAMSLGADRRQTFLKITFPLIRPGVLTASLFAFLLSFDDLILPLYLGGERSVTLPRLIWSGLRFSTNPTIAAVSVLTILLSLFVLVSVELLRRQSHRLRD